MIILLKLIWHGISLIWQANESYTDCKCFQFLCDMQMIGFFVKAMEPMPILQSSEKYIIISFS